MSVSIYSIVMSIIWFTLAALIGSFVLRKTAKGGLAFLSLIFFLALLRGIFPLEFSNSVIIRSKHWYPFLQNLIQTPIFQSFTIGFFILSVLFFGVVIRLLLAVRKMTLLHKFCKKAQLEQSDSILFKLATDVGKELNYTGSIDLSVSHSATTAYQAGFTHPFILLPRNVESFTDEEIRCMLRHELCHFLGNDLWIKACLQVLTCIFWWNPIMSLLNPSIEQMLELRCDQRAYRDLSQETQLTYLETLLHLSKTNSMESPPLSLGYIGSNEDEKIIQRFKLIQEANSHISHNMKTICSITICLVLFVASYFITIQPWSEPFPTDGASVVSYNSEASYIIHTSDGKFELYIDGIYICALLEDETEQEPFCNYVIYEGGYPNEETHYFGD